MQSASQLETERIELINRIREWNENRLDLFEISFPNQNLEFFGAMRFYFQGDDQKYQTKCLRVSSTATTRDLIGPLVEKFHPDLKMLGCDIYGLYEVHSNGDERRLSENDRPLLVQLNWGKDDRDGKFILKNETRVNRQREMNNNASLTGGSGDTFKREKKRLSKREKKKKEQMEADQKKATALPDSTFTRTISNPELVMARRRKQKLEKIEQASAAGSKSATLKVYGDALKPDIPYKALLLTTDDTCSDIVAEMLDKYNMMPGANPGDYCLVKIWLPPREDRQAYRPDQLEEPLPPDERPLDIMFNRPPAKGTFMFQVRPVPAGMRQQYQQHLHQFQLHRQQQKQLQQPQPQPPVAQQPPHQPLNGRSMSASVSQTSLVQHQQQKQQHQQQHPQQNLDLPYLVELNPDGSDCPAGRLVRLPIDQPAPIQLGSSSPSAVVAGSGTFVQLSHPDVQPVHCLINLRPGEQPPSLGLSPANPACAVWINNQRVSPGSWAALRSGVSVRLGRDLLVRFIDPLAERRYMQQQQQQLQQQQQQQQLQQQQQQQLQPQQPPPPPHVAAASVPTGPLDDLPCGIIVQPQHDARLIEEVVFRCSPQSVRFRLAPAYALYLTERAVLRDTNNAPDTSPGRLDNCLLGVADSLSAAVADSQTEPQALVFWLANASEHLHFVKRDAQLSDLAPGTVEHACDIIAAAVQSAFNMLLADLQDRLQADTPALLAPESQDDLVPYGGPEDEPLELQSNPPSCEQASLLQLLRCLSGAMVVLRRCRVNAALTIQLFSQLFHFLNASVFNQLVSPQPAANEPAGYLTARWGDLLLRRLERVKAWAERQGLELAAECHLARSVQACHLLLCDKSDFNALSDTAANCLRLNSAQTGALLSGFRPALPRTWIDSLVEAARQSADPMHEEEGLAIELLEELDLNLPLLLPDDGYTCDAPLGVPNGLEEFLAPLTRQGLCLFVPHPGQQRLDGLWTVFMPDVGGGSQQQQVEDHRDSARMSQVQQQQQQQQQQMPKPAVQQLQLAKFNNSLGLSIVSATALVGPDQGVVGTYIKAVIPGGAADRDARLEIGDQLLAVNGQSLIGLSQREAAGVLQRTGQSVGLTVAKRADRFHGLAEILRQPSPPRSPAVPEHPANVQQRQQQQQPSPQQRPVSQHLQQTRLPQQQQQQPLPPQPPQQQQQQQKPQPQQQRPVSQYQSQGQPRPPKQIQQQPSPQQHQQHQQQPSPQQHQQHQQQTSPQQHQQHQQQPSPQQHQQHQQQPSPQQHQQQQQQQQRHSTQRPLSSMPPPPHLQQQQQQPPQHYQTMQRPDKQHQIGRYQQQQQQSSISGGPQRAKSTSNMLDDVGPNRTIVPHTRRTSTTNEDEAAARAAVESLRRQDQQKQQQQQQPQQRQPPRVITPMDAPRVVIKQGRRGSTSDRPNHSPLSGSQTSLTTSTSATLRSTRQPPPQQQQQQQQQQQKQQPQHPTGPTAASGLFVAKPAQVLQESSPPSSPDASSASGATYMNLPPPPRPIEDRALFFGQQPPPQSLPPQQQRQHYQGLGQQRYAPSAVELSATARLIRTPSPQPPPPPPPQPAQQPLSYQQQQQPLPQPPSQLSRLDEMRVRLRELEDELQRTGSLDKDDRLKLEYLRVEVPFQERVLAEEQGYEDDRSSEDSAALRAMRLREVRETVERNAARREAQEEAERQQRAAEAAARQRESLELYERERQLEKLREEARQAERMRQHDEWLRDQQRRSGLGRYSSGNNEESSTDSESSSSSDDEDEQERQRVRERERRQQEEAELKRKLQQQQQQQEEAGRRRKQEEADRLLKQVEEEQRRKRADREAELQRDRMQREAAERRRLEEAEAAAAAAETERRRLLAEAEEEERQRRQMEEEWRRKDEERLRRFRELEAQTREQQLKLSRLRQSEDQEELDRQARLREVLQSKGASAPVGAPATIAKKSVSFENNLQHSGSNADRDNGNDGNSDIVRVSRYPGLSAPQQPPPVKPKPKSTSSSRPTSGYFDVGAASSVHTPTVIGAQEVYRDPVLRQNKHRGDNLGASGDGVVAERLSFHDKVRRFTGGDESHVIQYSERSKASSAQRMLDRPEDYEED